MGADAKFYNGGVWGTTRNTVPIFIKLSHILPKEICIRCVNFHSISFNGIEIEPKLEGLSQNTKTLEL